MASIFWTWLAWGFNLTSIVRKTATSSGRQSLTASGWLGIIDKIFFAFALNITFLIFTSVQLIRYYIQPLKK